MGLDIYVFKCKKEDYLLREKSQLALVTMCEEALYKFINMPPPAYRQDKLLEIFKVEHRCEVMAMWFSCQLYNWLIRNTDVEVDRSEVVQFKRDEIVHLANVCCNVLLNGTDATGEVNEEKCSRLLPNLEGYYFSTTDYDEDYIEEVETAFSDLSKLLLDVDFDNEIVLLYADW